MRRWWRRKPIRSDRQALVVRKRLLEGEIASLSSEVRARRRRGLEVGGLETRLAQMRDLHHRTRLEIDRTRPGD